LFISGGFSEVGAFTATLGNDIWVSSTIPSLRPWRRITNNAPWSDRAEHLFISGVTPLYGVETLYVLGGEVSLPDVNGFFRFHQ